MARSRRKSDADELFDSLAEAPWWVSIVVGLICYIVVGFVLPAVFGGDRMVGSLVTALSQFAWLSVIFLIPALASFLRFRGKRRMLDRQSSIESIRELSWKRFEELLGEAYRRHGFTVIENSGVGADGGIDLVIRRGGETYLVQAKQWKTYKVGVKVVREMLGLVTAHKAKGAIVVCSADFTQEARDFAAKNHVELVDGPALLELVRSLQSTASLPAGLASQLASDRICPSCGREMVLRTATRGANAGGRFWGCSGYPECRHTEDG